MKESPQWCCCTKHWKKMFPADFSLSYKQKRESKRERERVREGEKDCISGQCLLIATRHTSPQLSQIAIEKWPVMQLLANPGLGCHQLLKAAWVVARYPASAGALCHYHICRPPAHQLLQRGLEQDFQAPLPTLSHISDDMAKRRNWNCCIIYSNGYSEGEVGKVME